MLGLLIIAVAAAAITAAVVYGVRQQDRVADLRPGDYVDLTPVLRPTLNPANARLVGVLYGLAAAVEGTSHALRDIARTVQLHEAAPVSDPMRGRIAGIIEDGANVMRRGANEVLEAKEQT